MGCTSSKPRRLTEYEVKIEEDMVREAQMDKEKIKLLILGAGESGKSTVFKQMKMIYGVKFSDQERRNVLPLIHANIMAFMKSLCEAAILFEYMADIMAQEELEYVCGMPEEEYLDEHIGKVLMKLWNDPGIQKAWERRNEFQIIDSIQYYYKNMDRISKPDFLPNQDDMLYLRVRTTGIITEQYDIDGTMFEIYDVGGQRNERKKWIHCFEGVTAVIFVAAISEYGQKLFEDEKTNRMVSSIY